MNQNGKFIHNIYVAEEYELEGWIYNIMMMSL